MFNLSVVSFLLLVSISGTACAAKRAQTPAQAARATAASPAVSASSIEDVVQGLVDFEKRAARYSQDEWNFVLGYAHYRHGNWRESGEFLRKAQEKLPVVSGHIIFYRATVANRLGRGADALGLLDELKQSHPGSVWGSEAMIERARALISLGRYREARSSLGDYKRQANDDKVFDADRLIAKSYIDEGDSASAISSVRSLAINADGEGKLNELGDLIDDIRRRFGGDIRAWLGEPAQQLKLAQSFAARSQWDEAAARIERLLAGRRLDAATGTQAKWLLARAYRSIHRYDEAIRLMEEIAGDPNARGFSDSLLNTLATTYTKKNDYAKAISLRRRMMERSAPGSAAAAEMAYKIAFLYMDEGRYDEAMPLWRQALGMKGSGEKREQAEWYLAWCGYMSGRHQDAIARLDGMLKKGRKSDIHDRLQYWRGRVLEKIGRRGEAHEMYRDVIRDHPGGYYAELANRRLKGDKRSIENFADVGGVKGARGSSDFRIEEIAGGSPHMARAAFFDRLGLHEEAARELRASGGGPSDAILKLAARNFAHDVAYRIAEGNHHQMLKGGQPESGGPERPIWEAAYPRAYDPLVARLVRDVAVDPMLVWSVMRNESAFRPEVVSPAGAVGLMQLMPATANRLAADVGRDRIDRRELYRPPMNVSLGVAYLKKLAGMFPQNPVAWIASYNAGEEAVARWIANGGMDDVEEWIEEIPYDETNLYVKKVLNSYWKYQRLYSD